MWIFTKYGFFSPVCARQGDGSRGQPIDPHRMQIRARNKVHLESLQQRFPQLLKACEIKESPKSDYVYRMAVSKSIWVQLLTDLGSEMDYQSFQSEVERYQGTPGADFQRSLRKIWDVLSKSQKES